MIKILRKGIRIPMNEKMKEYGLLLSNEHNRLILGLVLTGLGVGLIVSAYVRVLK